MSEKKFKVGEVVVLVDFGPDGRVVRREFTARVTKSGPRWAEVYFPGSSGTRFDAVSGWRDSGGYTPTCRIVRPEDWEAEKEETSARDKLRAIGVMVDGRQAPKHITNKAVWEALRGLVEQS